MNKLLNTHLTVALLTVGLGSSLVFTTLSKAGEHCRCHHCGCQNACEKICRLVPDEKKVTVTCWAVQEEDFCLSAGPSKRGCKHCEEVCEECDQDPKTPNSPAKPFIWFDWTPNCSANMFTKNKLMKKTITKKVPGYKWVVEDLCAQCEPEAKSVEVPAGTKVPTPPTDVKKK